MEKIIIIKFIKMKTDKPKAKLSKFNLEKMKVAKLDNLHLINGGDNTFGDDPVTITDKVLSGGSSRVCKSTT
ncbi:hypothetical protein IQ02_01993 [Flavobacterium glaciei]|uniref:Uncharacterized protein n=2 Tax=Flavobacterium glaciei TaxID=386300 RepID=A0A562PPX6_9FLAO|nr:hypothetical protein DFR66_109133 [Flavobacterium glaciei]TWI46469.1 hypothetical protein IQ02_01993 [Flavobacterium glaciei]